MTCIVGLVHQGVVHLGGDSAGVGGMDLRVRRDVKVFTKGDMVIGCTSSFRMIQLLQYGLAVVKRHPDMDVMEYMVTVFVEAIRKCFREGGFARKVNEEEHAGVFLVGYAGRLFRIDSDYQVGECADGYDACGCGESYAMGSLHASEDIGDPKARLQLALECAAHFSAGVRGPFVYHQTKVAA